MKSKLVIVPVEKLQSKIVSTLRSLSGVGIYVALDKNPKRIREILKKKKINTNNLFFIDCVGSDSPEKEIIQIKPTKLNEIDYAVKSFIANIKGKKFLMTDSLSTLLIYNDENNVAAHVRKITEYATKKDVEIIAFSPKTKEKELLKKIFNFFDKVEGK